MFPQNCCPTQRAPDWWESPRFQAVYWLGVGSGKVAISRPAHQRVTPVVSPLRSVMTRQKHRDKSVDGKRSQDIWLHSCFSFQPCARIYDRTEHRVLDE